MHSAKKHTLLQKKQQMQVKAFALLLLYLFISSPAILFHHHELDVASYAKATPCEKTIFYAHVDESCHHTSHFTKAFEACFLCDTHTVSPHTPIVFYQANFSMVAYMHFVDFTHPLFAQKPSSFSNKGPPSVSSPTA